MGAEAVPGCDRSKETPFTHEVAPALLQDESVIQPNVPYLMIFDIWWSLA